MDGREAMIEDAERDGNRKGGGSACVLCSRWVAAVGFEVMQVVNQNDSPWAGERWLMVLVATLVA